MNIKIDHKYLPTLLGIIGRALGEGKDLEISESIHPEIRYLYTRVGDGKLELLGEEGNSSLSVNPDDEDLKFSDTEIKDMEITLICPLTEDQVDKYWCSHLCPSRKECGYDKR